MSFTFGKKKQSNKHAKLHEGWSEHKEPYKDGVIFELKYLGSHLIEELREGQSYTDGRSSETIRTIKNFRSLSGKKTPADRVELCVKSTGITVRQQATKRDIIISPIERISFCTADSVYPKVFAFFARNTINETMECYAFSCPSPKVALEVAQGVNQAFQLAKDELIEKLEEQRTSKNMSPSTPDEPSSKPSSEPSKTSWVSFDD